MLWYMKRKDKTDSNKIKIFYSLIVIIVGIFLILQELVSKIYKNYEEKKFLDNFYTEVYDKENQEDNNLQQEKVEKDKDTDYYIAVITIPKIKLKKGLVNTNSKRNNIKYNIQILFPVSMPDEKNGNLILAAHSGNAKVSYFKKLYKLNVDDSVIIEYKKTTYTYKVKKIYEINKTGSASIIRNHNVNTLTLITCKHNSNKQIVIICEINI